MQTNSRLFWPDLIRACAILLVVFVHATGSIINAGYYATDTFSWWFATALNGLGRAGVPLFFMLSGALLLGRPAKGSPWEFVKKRVGRILILFIVWSVVYIFWRVYRYNFQITPRVFVSIFAAPVYYHLWFFYSIIGLYLVSPFIRSLDRSTYLYITILWLLTVPVYYMISHFIGCFTLENNFHKVVLSYMGYFTGGVLLRDICLDKKKTALAVVAIIACLVLITIETTHLTLKNRGVFDGFWFNYLNVAVVVMSVALFLTLRFFADRINNRWERKFVHVLSICSLGIFVVHPIIMETFSLGLLGFRLNATTFNPFAGILLTFIAVTIVSTSIVAVLSRIPLIRKCV